MVLMRRGTTDMTRLPKTRIVLVLVSVCALLLAGCGSSSKGTTSATTSSGNASSQLGQVKSENAAALKPLTTIPLTTPLTSKPPANKTFVWMACDVATCTTLGNALKTAAAAAGWQFSQVAYSTSNPATLVAALQQALRLHPAAVAVSAEPEAVWGSVLPAYQAAGVPIIAAYVGPLTVASPVIVNIAGATDEAKQGTTLANWFVADSNGKGTALFVNVTAFPYLGGESGPFTDRVKTVCPGCSLVPLDLTLAQETAGTENAAIVAALRKNPNINYVLSTTGAFIAGLPSALSAAGLSGKVKTATLAPTQENLSDIQAGSETGAVSLASNYSSWLMIDSAIRSTEGLPISDGDGGLPVQMLTKGVNFSVSDSQDPANYSNQVKKLWLLGS